MTLSDGCCCSVDTHLVRPVPGAVHFVIAGSTDPLRAYDANGLLAWSIPLPSSAVTWRPGLAINGSRQTALAASYSSTDQLSLYEADGSVAWTATATASGVRYSRLLWGPNGNIIAHMSNDDVRQYDAADGSVLWSKTSTGYTGHTCCDPEDSGGFVYAFSTDGSSPNRGTIVHKLDPDDGAELATLTIAAGGGGEFRAGQSDSNFSSGTYLYLLDQFNLTMRRVAVPGIASASAAATGFTIPLDQTHNAIATSGGIEDMVGNRNSSNEIRYQFPPAGGALTESWAKTFQTVLVAAERGGTYAYAYAPGKVNRYKLADGLIDNGKYWPLEINSLSTNLWYDVHPGRTAELS